jgi:L-serine dehydratase
MVRQRSVFDIVGPVMIGPSSSHTAGACRLGGLAREIFGEQPSHVKISLHGSFASTGPGHGTDLALVAGLLGMRPDDVRIPDALALAAQAGVDVEFAEVELGDVHPNTAQLEFTGPIGNTMLVCGSSLGGGDVVVTQIDGFEVEATGELPLLLVAHLDRPGEIAAVTSLLAESRANIASMQVSRERRGAGALMLIETDTEIDRVTAQRIEVQPGVTSVRRIAAIYGVAAGWGTGPCFCIAWACAWQSAQYCASWHRVHSFIETAPDFRSLMCRPCAQSAGCALGWHRRHLSS